MLTGIFLPQRLTKSPSPRALFCRGGWVLFTRSTSHGSRLKICSNGCASAAAEEISVRTSAASLKNVILPSVSTATTPSSRLARICSHDICVVVRRLGWLDAFIVKELLRNHSRYRRWRNGAWGGRPCIDNIAYGTNF